MAHEEKERINLWASMPTRKVIRPVLEGVKKGSTVFDLGCGTGGYPLEMALSGYDVIALDIDPHAIGLLELKINSLTLDEKQFVDRVAEESQKSPTGTFYTKEDMGFVVPDNEEYIQTLPHQGPIKLKVVKGSYTGDKNSLSHLNDGSIDAFTSILSFEVEDDSTQLNRTFDLMKGKLKKDGLLFMLWRMHGNSWDDYLVGFYVNDRERSLVFNESQQKGAAIKADFMEIMRRFGFTKDEDLIYKTGEAILGYRPHDSSSPLKIYVGRKTQESTETFEEILKTTKGLL